MANEIKHSRIINSLSLYKFPHFIFSITADNIPLSLFLGEIFYSSSLKLRHLVMAKNLAALISQYQLN